MKRTHVSEDRMHGSIFVLLRRFVESTYGHSTWARLLEASGVGHAGYQMQEMYPAHEVFAIISKLGEETEQSVFDLLEQYGSSLCLT